MKRKFILSLSAAMVACICFAGAPAVLAENNAAVIRYDYEEQDAAVFSDENSAAAYLRDQMVQRYTTITVHYHVDNGVLPESTAESIYWKVFDRDATSVAANAKISDYLRFSVRSQAKTTNKLGNGDYDLVYTIEYIPGSDNENESSVDEFVDNFISTNVTGKNLSEYDKVKLVYDYIAKNVYYDHEAYDSETANGSWTDSHTAYAALKSKKSVCQGYAMATYRLLTQMGIETRFLRGEGWKNNDATKRDVHDFNMVKVNGKWYYLDSNWGAMFKEQVGGKVGDVDYTWFLKSQEDFVYHAVNENESAPDVDFRAVEPSNSYADSDAIKITGYAPSYTMYDMDGNYRGIPDKPVVLTFIRTKGDGDGLYVNTDYWVSQLIYSKRQYHNDVEFYIVDVSKSPNLTALGNLANMGFERSNIICIGGSYTTQAYWENVVSEFAANAGYSSFDESFTFSFPFTCVVDRSGRIAYTFNPGRKTNGSSLPVYLTYNNLNRKLAYLLQNPTSDTRANRGLPGKAATIGMQRPDGTGKYAGTLTGVYENMEYRKQGTSVYYPGNSTGNVTGLTAGTYYVRYKGTNTYKPSPDKELLVAAAAPRSGITSESRKDGSIYVSWPAVPYAIGYQVYRSTKSDDLNSYALVGTVQASAAAGPSFTDTSALQEETTYYYRIKSFIKSKSGKIVQYSDLALSGYTGRTSRKAVKIMSAGTAITKKQGQVGLNYTLKYVISSAFANESLKSVTIEDPTIATITSLGSDGSIKITNKKVGTTNLVVTLNSGFQAKCVLEVMSSVSLKEKTIDLSLIRSSDTTKANQYKLVPTVYPSTVTVTYRSGNTSVATVDANGLITAKGVGNTRVYAKSSKGEEVSVLVRVTQRVYVSSVKAAYSEKTIFAGNTFSFSNLTIQPSNAQVQSITYSVGNTGIATVDSSGLVTGVANGNTYLTIVVKDVSGASVSTKVLLHIREIALTKINLRYAEKTIVQGREFQFVTKLEPANTTMKDIKFRIGNTSIATVDSTGKVKGLSVGNTWLYAEAKNGTSAKVLIKVVPYVPIQSFTIRYVEKTLKVGTQFQFTAVITPSNATDKTVTFRTGNSSIATVDATGKVTAVSSGNTYLYATNADGVTVKCLLKIQR